MISSTISSRSCGTNWAKSGRTICSVSRSLYSPLLLAITNALWCNAFNRERQKMRVALACCNSGQSLNTNVTPLRCEPSSSPNATGEVELTFRVMSTMKRTKSNVLLGSC